MNVRSYRDLEAWQKAMDLVVACYKVSEAFPKSEIYGLASQLQRAAVSVPSNIAEGQGRQHTLEFIQHLSIAYGSLCEIETQLQIAGRLGYLSPSRCEELLQQTGQTGRLINGLLRALRNKD